MTMRQYLVGTCGGDNNQVCRAWGSPVQAVLSQNIDRTILIVTVFAQYSSKYAPYCWVDVLNSNCFFVVK